MTAQRKILTRKLWTPSAPALLHLVPRETALLLRHRRIWDAINAGDMQAAEAERMSHFAPGFIYAPAGVVVTPGSQTFNSGSGNWTTENYNTLEVELWGGGGSSSGRNPGGSLGTDRAGNSDGSASTCTGLSLSAGRGASGLGWSQPGAGGTASGGDTNTTGTAGISGSNPNPTAQTSATGGNGGASPNGGATCAGSFTNAGTHVAGTIGNAPGGGSGAGCRLFFVSGDGVHAVGGGGGGGGAYCKKTFTAGVTPGAPAFASLVAYVVGAGSTYTNGTQSGVFVNSANGAVGRVRFTWS